MSRLCRLKTASHGDDGKWAYGEIIKLRQAIESQAAEIEKYKTLCDQMGAALEHYQLGIDGGLICIPNGCMTKALEAWRSIK